MGKRSRRRQRGAKQDTPRAAAGDCAGESGLLKGQTHPEMRERLQRIGEQLRVKYGTIADQERSDAGLL